MDLKGSLVDTKLKIYPSKKLFDFLKTIPISNNTPVNIAKLVKGEEFTYTNNSGLDRKPVDFTLNDKDLEIIKGIKENLKTIETDSDSSQNLNKVVTKNDVEITEDKNLNSSDVENKDLNKKVAKSKNIVTIDTENKNSLEIEPKKKGEKSERMEESLYLSNSDIDWLYSYLQKGRNSGEKDVPYLHVLLEGADIELPENVVIKRNPVLEERCVKLRAQQEAREYRKMTKGVDNVRMRFPEDSISYQLKQINRHLIAIGQFILSIFAGFLFGFKGIEWMVGPLEFGFKLLLGIMCSLIIALAEIYFLAKKLNEELNVPETIQLGGPTKFVNEPTCHGHKISLHDKEHKD
ncbi:uncharacterized protein LOC131843450 [Achroia grisella]|uniref:uncharacterized protein LOC131843450 n=1 Tax=Achroia grisella TaxID=688607 RepID=UPI0027D2D21E|nr:uncharacterized protein LOC131843450 [Achroia grisella]